MAVRRESLFQRELEWVCVVPTQRDGPYLIKFGSDEVLRGGRNGGGFSMSAPLKDIVRMS